MKKIIVIIALTITCLRLSAQEMNAKDVYTGLTFGGFSFQQVFDVGGSIHSLAGISLRVISNRTNARNGGFCLYYLFDPWGAMDDDSDQRLTQVFFLYGQGKILNRGHKVQFPIFFDYGLGYSGSTESTLWFWSWGGTVQIKYYLTQRFGIFTGADAMLGVGFGNSKLGWMFSGQVNAGLIFTFGS